MRPSGGPRQATLFQAWGAPSGRPGDVEAEAPAPPSGFVGGAAGGLWLFPWAPGLEERGYQVRAARAALEANTLLCLPTGLGKTLVAAVVLHNFYRWFPAGRAVFLAPTKPLVAQQRDACARLSPVPRHHLARMDGETQVVNRKAIWRTKRVFFLTPQVMINDLSRGLCPAMDIKCLVIDEAHRALGNHAYCQVVTELCKYTRQFRILALSATPGSDKQAVQQVISNLLISHIEHWSEDSPEIQPYSHQRLVEKCVVPLGEELSEMRAAYLRVLESSADRLVRFRVLPQRDISTLTKYQIIVARDQFRKNPASCFSGKQQGIIEGDFALCISLYHGYELLLQMGMRSLYIFLSGTMAGSKGTTRAKNELSRNEEFMALYGILGNMFAETSETSARGNMSTGKEKLKPFTYSHPKLKKLEEVVVEHFRSWKEQGDQRPAESKPADTRVMIFSSFRDSVCEIAEMLNRLHPVVRVMTFVGHSTGKNAKGFTQKEQLEVVKLFRAGGYNTLVSTCVGEEGLDIGEVDLIICFDAQKSPIRLVQRMGRTGRKRKGRIVVILSEGREERTYNQSQSNKRSILKAISESKGLHFYQHSPRMIPEGVHPTMHRILVTPPEREPSPSPPGPSEGRAVALQRKWLPGYAGTGAKQPEDGYLTAEEFEVWNRSYRVKAEDGLKQPVMPQSGFETLKDGEKETESSLPADGVCELSLTEWRLWQNRPFPTHFVDHSDRCGHFVSVMEMIEQMRHEEGDCSYELKIQPHLHREDVDASVLKRSKIALDSVAAPKASSSRKTRRVSPVLDGSASSSSCLQDLEAECVSLFKAASFNPAKRPHTLRAGAEGCSRESSGLSGRVLPADEGAGPQASPDRNKDCSVASAGHKTAAAGEFPGAVGDCRSGVGRRAESDSGCFSEDNLLVSDSLFYLPVLEKGVSVLPAPCAAEDPPRGRDVLTSATGLLSQIPPSLDKLFDLLQTNEACRPDSEQKGVSPLPADGYSLAKLPASSEFQKMVMASQNTSELTGFPNPCSLRKGVLEASVGNDNDGDINWDEVFDDDDDLQVGIENPNPPVANGGLAESPLRGGVCGGRETSCKHPGGNMGQETGGSDLWLGNERGSKRSRLSDGKSREGSASQGSCGQAGIPAEDLGISQWHLPNEHIPEGPGDPVGSLLVHQDKALETVDPAGGAALPHEELYDISQELFSVNFELEFSSQESEDGGSEPAAAVGNNGGRVSAGSPSNGNSAKGSPLTWSKDRLGRTKVSTPVHLQNQKPALEVTAGLIPGASPLTPAGRKPCSSPGSARHEFSTPKNRPTSNCKVPRGVNLSHLFGNMPGSPTVSAPSQAKTDMDKKGVANSASRIESFASQGAGNREHRNQNSCTPISVEAGVSSGSEDEVVFLGKSKRKRNVLVSPNMNNSYEDESPVHAVRKRRRPLSALNGSSDESTDFCKEASRICFAESQKPGRGVKRQKQLVSKATKSAAQQFIDEEAEVSDDEAVELSSDETANSENELMSSSLHQFLNDETQIMQGLNESEMQAVYLKSVRSPAICKQRKTLCKPFDPAAVFSQVPEQDESYLVDSFCVQEGEEEEEEEERQPKGSSSEGEEIGLNFDLLGEESFVEGRKQYCTRRRRKQKEARAEEPRGAPGRRRKPSRILIVDDSSEEEGSARSETLVEALPNSKPGAGGRSVSSRSLDSSLQRRNSSPKNLEGRTQFLLDLKGSLAGELDFQPPSKGSSKTEPLVGDPQSSLKLGVSPEPRMAPFPSSSARPPRGSLGNRAPLCILVDSREISSGPSIISTLKATHGVKVQVCPLGSCDYIVSNRLAVERMSQAELLNGAQRSKAAQRAQQLKSTFDRICVLIEKERAKAGEAQRGTQRTKHYDSLLSSFLRGGIRVLFSSSQEETAELLKELALVEQRKGAAIVVPTEVQGPGQDALRFYLSMPGVSYVAALALCHGFRSVEEMANSSPSELAARAQVTRQKAEEIYRYLHYGFDKQMLPERVT